MEKKIGTVVKYFTKVGVAAVVLDEENLQVGDTIIFRGHTTDFEQVVESMQIDNEPVTSAGPGQSIGIKVKDRARPNDEVLKVVD